MHDSCEACTAGECLARNFDYVMTGGASHMENFELMRIHELPIYCLISLADLNVIFFGVIFHKYNRNGEGQTE